MEEYCPKCHGPLANRLIQETIHGGFSGGGWTWKYSCKSRCVNCSRLPCMVEGCSNRAAIVIRHGMAVGSGKASTGLRNDLWICSDHRSAVDTAQLHEGLFAFGCLGGIGTAGLIAILAYSNVSPFVIALVIIGAAVGSWFLYSTKKEIDRMSGSDGPVSVSKKQKYITTVRGDSGSLWEDDSWDGDFLN